MLGVLLASRGALFKNLQIAERLPVIRIISRGLMLGMLLGGSSAVAGIMQGLLRLTVI